ncbi:hypothetical protein ACS0TY_025694 [Phlomoides rotata]
MVGMRPQPSILVYNKQLSRIVKMKHHSVALSVFDEMRRKSAPVNEYTFNITINCYCLLSRVDFGLSILGIIFKSGYEPNVTTFTILFFNRVTRRKTSRVTLYKVVEAEKLFKKLLVLKICEPDDVMILTVINGLCKAGQTIPAFELLHALEKTRWKPNVYAYSALIDELCKGGMMTDKGISPDVVTCSFSILVNAYCKEGRVRDAEHVLEVMMQQNVCPNTFTYNALIEGYCVEGSMGKAKQLFNSIGEKGLKPCIITYNTLIDGRFVDGWKLFEDMEVQQSLLRRNELFEAIPFLEEMCERGFSADVDTMSLLIDELAQDRENVMLLEMIKNLVPKDIMGDGQKMPPIEEIEKMLTKGSIDRIREKGTRLEQRNKGKVVIQGSAIALLKGGQGTNDEGTAENFLRGSDSEPDDDRELNKAGSKNKNVEDYDSNDDVAGSLERLDIVGKHRNLATEEADKAEDRDLFAFRSMAGKEINSVHGKDHSISTSIRLFKKTGGNKCVLLSDSMEAVNLVTRKDKIWSPMGSVRDAILQELSDVLVWDIAYAPRTANKTAHKLAKVVRSSPEPLAWFGADVPFWIRELGQAG